MHGSPPFGAVRVSNVLHRTCCSPWWKEVRCLKRGFHKWGLQEWLFVFGISHLEMDDDWGYAYIRRPQKKVRCLEPCIVFEMCPKLMLIRRSDSGYVFNCAKAGQSLSILVRAYHPIKSNIPTIKHIQGTVFGLGVDGIYVFWGAYLGYWMRFYINILWLKNLKP